MVKKLIGIAVVAIMMLGIFGLTACNNGDYGVKPADLDDPMPEIWEEGFDDIYDFSIIIDINHATEYTIGADVLKFSRYWENDENLEHIYVEEGNPFFISENGAVYSKSLETLFKWPTKKPVTQPKDTIKYFEWMCYANCDIPEDFDLPDGTISIGGGAFRNSNLRQLHIKENVKTVYSGFPKSLKRIEISAPIVYASFFDARNAETIIFHEGVKQLRGKFLSPPSDNFAILLEVQTVEFPGTLEAIGDVFFPANTTVKGYIIPKSVKFIDEFAFFDYNYFHYSDRGFVTDWSEINCTTKFDCKSNYAKKRIAEIKKEWGKKGRYSIITD